MAFISEGLCWWAPFVWGDRYMNMKQHHFQSDESCHFPLLCKGNTTSAHPAAISHCQEWRPKKPLCCTHKCNWIPEKPAQLISTLRSFNTLLLKVQPGICRNWHFLGACEKCGTPGISHHCVQGRKYSLYHWGEGETADPEAKLSASSFSAIVRAHIVLPPFSFF